MTYFDLVSVCWRKFQLASVCLRSFCALKGETFPRLQWFSCFRWGFQSRERKGRGRRWRVWLCFYFKLFAKSVWIHDSSNIVLFLCTRINQMLYILSITVLLSIATIVCKLEVSKLFLILFHSCSIYWQSHLNKKKSLVWLKWRFLQRFPM